MKYHGVPIRLSAPAQLRETRPYMQDLRILTQLTQIRSTPVIVYALRLRRVMHSQTVLPTGGAFVREILQGETRGHFGHSRKASPLTRPSPSRRGSRRPMSSLILDHLRERSPREIALWSRLRWGRSQFIVRRLPAMP